MNWFNLLKYHKVCNVASEAEFAAWMTHTESWYSALFSFTYLIINWYKNKHKLNWSIELIC